MPLHPEARALLDFLAAWQQENGIPARSEQSIEQSREVQRQMSALRAADDLPPLGSVQDMQLATRSGPRAARIYRPRAGGPLPTLVYVHGGGYVVGGIAESHAEAHRFAASMPANVVSLSYRLAPEHPWPAPVDDIEDAVAAIVGGAIAGLELAPLILAGVSAGAGLVAAVTRRFVERGASPIGLCLLLSPWLDVTLTNPSASLFSRGHQLEREVLEGFRQAYVPPGVPADHPELSPARHPVPEGWPETILFAAECDPLADDAALFARRLSEAGAPHTCRFVPGMLHGFHGWFGRLPSLASDLKWLDTALRDWATAAFGRRAA